MLSKDARNGLPNTRQGCQDQPSRASFDGIRMGG
jgi:hypothetical protein